MTILEDLFSIRGKTAVVTGGSRGIGEMIARGFVEAGARVYISSRKAEVCDAVAKELSEHGECISIPSDLSTVDGVEHVVREVSAREDELHILVNNAGAAWGAPLEEFPDGGWDKVIAINLKGPFNLTQRFLPLLRAAATPDDPARVINIGSIDGIRVPWFENFSYSASKAGIHMLTRHIAHRVHKDNITVNAIAPGLFPSQMTKVVFEDESVTEQVTQNIPLGRHGRMEDIAGTCIYLSSRAGSFLTGAIIPVDGGVATHG